MVGQPWNVREFGAASGVLTQVLVSLALWPLMKVKKVRPSAMMDWTRNIQEVSGGFIADVYFLVEVVGSGGWKLVSLEMTSGDCDLCCVMTGMRGGDC